MGRKKNRSSPLNIYESFSDMALIMLATFIFLLVTLLITSKMAEQYQVPRLQRGVDNLQKQLNSAKAENRRLLHDMDEVTAMTPQTQMDKSLAAAGLDTGKNKKDFDLFVQGLKDLPGRDLHLVVDGTGSMHGVTNFLIPVLRVIVIRSGKRLSAVTWFSDGKTETYTGSMGEMFDKLMSGAPFIGNQETLGWAFRHVEQDAPVPGAYLVIGDEPPSDEIAYLSIPAPVFTLPLGKDNPDTLWAYQKLADQTKGKMLRLEFQ